MSRQLSDLSDAFKPKAFELLARCVEARIAVAIVDTLRTPEEQAANIAKGVSWTKNSKHLPDATGKSNAIDLCLYETYLAHGNDKFNWDASDPLWQEIGALGESLGLTWGGRWTVRDLGHFQLK